MSLPLGALLALQNEGPAHLDALVSEVAVRHALQEDGLHVAGFGLWAVRRHAQRQDPLERILRQPKDWTWLVFAPVSPQALPARDAELLARLIQGLHGVQYLHWTVQAQGITFTAASLRTTVVRGVPVLLPTPPRPDGTLPLPEGPLLPDLSRWASVPEAHLAAALIETAYIHRLAGAERWAFTNVDVLALDGTQPLVVEVKRRARTVDQATEPLIMTTTQAGMLGHLAAAGCEVHVVVRVVPKGSTRSPEEAMQQGQWQAGAPLIRPGWGAMYVDLLRIAEPLSLVKLRRVRELTRARERPAPRAAPVNSAARPLRPAPSAQQRASRPAPEIQLHKPRRLVSFSFEYAFLQIWTPAPVKLGGREYANAAAAFLAARTLDDQIRTELASTSTPGPALRLAERSPVRPDWSALREDVAVAVLRSAYRGERGAQLVSTLPMLLADAEVWSPVLDGLQGLPLLRLLGGLRGALAVRQIPQRPGCCGGCRWARQAPWSGFVQCGHPEGSRGTLNCVGKQACRGPRGEALVAVTTRGGAGFRSK